MAKIVAGAQIALGKGFPRCGFQAEKILGAGTDDRGKMYFRIKGKGEDTRKARIIPAELTNLACPQVIIRFYEEHLNFY